MFKKLLRSKKAQIISIVVSIIIIIGCLSAVIIPMLMNSDKPSGAYKSNLITASGSIEIKNDDKKDKEIELESEKPVDEPSEVSTISTKIYDDIYDYMGYWHSSTYAADAELYVTTGGGQYVVRVSIPRVVFGWAIFDGSSNLTIYSDTNGAVNGEVVNSTMSLNNGIITLNLNGYHMANIYTFDTQTSSSNGVTDESISGEHCPWCGLTIYTGDDFVSLHNTTMCTSCYEHYSTVEPIIPEYVTYCSKCGAEIITTDPYYDPYYTSGFCESCYAEINSPKVKCVHCSTILTDGDLSNVWGMSGYCYDCYYTFVENNSENTDVGGHQPNVFCPVCGWGLYTTSVGYDGFVCEECGTHFLHDGTILEN